MRFFLVCICWLFLVHHHHLSCLMTCYENDFGVKSVEIGFFAPSFLLNGFLPSGVWKSHVLFQWPPSQQVNWSSFLSSLLPLKVHRIIKSRFGSTYLLLSFQNTVSWGPWTAQLWAILQNSTTQIASYHKEQIWFHSGTYFFPSQTQCPETHGQLNFEYQ